MTMDTPPWGIQAWEQWRDYMTSKSEIKRQTIQRGGSMDDAARILEAAAIPFVLGDFKIAHTKKGIWIRYKTGEGGEFNAEDLEAYVAKFFWENF